MAIDVTACRAVGHRWDLIPNRRRPPWGEMATHRCEGCGLIREDIYDSLGQLSSRNYIKPPGYNDAPKMAKRNWRVAYLRDTKSVRNQRKAS